MVKYNPEYSLNIKRKYAKNVRVKLQVNGRKYEGVVDPKRVCEVHPAAKILKEALKKKEKEKYIKRHRRSDPVYSLHGIQKEYPKFHFSEVERVNQFVKRGRRNSAPQLYEIE